MSAVLEARDLVKSYGSLKVLRGVSFRVPEGETVALLGPSGCGKTTLLRILLGLESADEGAIAGAHGAVGYLPQDGLLFPWKTVMGNAELPRQIGGISRRTRRAEIRTHLQEFGLEGFERAYPHELSGGMCQRAALLRTVMTGCPVLVLDEPFGALDTVTRHRMQDWLAGLLGHLGRTSLFVTHDLDEAVALARSIVLLTERPASVRGRLPIDLSPTERGDRTGRAFIAARDALLSMIEAAHHA